MPTVSAYAPRNSTSFGGTLTETFIPERYLSTTAVEVGPIGAQRPSWAMLSTTAVIARTITGFCPAATSTP